MSAMDNVAEVLLEILTDAKDADVERLREAMNGFAKYSRSLADCRKQPAFRKLWDAMDEATGATMIRQMEEELWTK